MVRFTTGSGGGGAHGRLGGLVINLHARATVGKRAINTNIAVRKHATNSTVEENMLLILCY